MADNDAEAADVAAAEELAGDILALCDGVEVAIALGAIQKSMELIAGAYGMDKQFLINAFSKTCQLE